MITTLLIVAVALWALVGLPFAIAVGRAFKAGAAAEEQVEKHSLVR